MFTENELIMIREHTEHLASFEEVTQQITERLGDGTSYYTEEETRAILDRKLKGLDATALWDIIYNI